MPLSYLTGVSTNAHSNTQNNRFDDLMTNIVNFSDFQFSKYDLITLLEMTDIQQYWFDRLISRQEKLSFWIIWVFGL